MKIYAPVKDFNGLRNNVRFVKGVGETNDPIAVLWFKSHGYQVEKSVEKCDEPLEKLVEKCDEITEHIESTEPDFEAMTPIQLREWMTKNGYGSKIRNTRNKEKLLEILRG